MHRFYLEGSSGRVGASWMTKEAREDDKKENQTNYFVLGNEDPYFSENQFLDTVNFYSNLGFKIIEYTGNHSIDSGILKDLLNSLK